MPHEDALKPAGKTVLKVLELIQHPDQTEPHADAFVECDELPILLEVTVTEEYILHTNCQVQQDQVKLIQFFGNLYC